MSGSTLYGMTFRGGSSNKGVVFKINSDGTGYAILRSFTDGTGGSEPYGSLTLSGSTLYGMTLVGGNTGFGTVFKVNCDGTGFTILHNCGSSRSGDGFNPRGSLTLSGSTLYGMMAAGGSSSNGVVFQINRDGTGYTILHNFAGGLGDGAYPRGSLTLSGSTLYGMTPAGGSSSNGVVFALALSTAWDSGYQDLGNGWRRLSWFGDYVGLGNNWIWHPKFGYEYVHASSTPTSIFFWDLSGLGWLWTSSIVYPFLYRFSDGAWLWYQKGSASPRWFLNMTTSAWESH